MDNIAHKVYHHCSYKTTIEMLTFLLQMHNNIMET